MEMKLDVKGFVKLNVYFFFLENFKLPEALKCGIKNKYKHEN
jgi:hypothetical protein